MSFSSLPSTKQTNADQISDEDFAKVAHLFDSLTVDEKVNGVIKDNIDISNDTLTDFQTIVYNELAFNNGVQITIPLYFDDETYTAMVDTGATKSFIDISVVERANLKMHKVSGNIYLGHKEMHVARMGHTDDITIECNKRSIMTPFEVFQLKHDFVIGLDLLPRLGISLSGIEDGRDSAQRLPPPIPDEIPAILPLTTPPEELTPEFKKEKADFILAISDALAANSAIPHSSHCPLPEMRVALEVPRGTVLFRRPRVFAEQQQQIFDEQIEKWIKDGIIVKAPVGNPHNNTLTLAAKKDLLGRKTKWRVCLDPRPLNKLLPDDNHPVPLFDIFCTIGFPRIIQSDNGSEFVNTLIRTMLSKVGTNHRLLTPYHPRGNGVAERHVRIAIENIKRECKQDDAAWDTHVPMTQLSMNTRIVALHNSSPFSLFFARKFNGFHNFTNSENALLSHDELSERLKYMTEVVFPAIDKKSSETQAKMIARFNASILHNVFPDGSKVMTLDPIQSGKLTPRYEGPYTVVRRTSGGSYELKDGTGTLLGRRYAPSQLKMVIGDEDNQFPVYDVETILDHRPHPTKEGEWEYRTKWEGYSDKHCTWEPEENFIEKKCIRDYWKKYNATKSQNSSNSTQPRSLRTRSKRTIEKRTPSPPRRNTMRRRQH
jgi:predicted aspartyl protease